MVAITISRQYGSGGRKIATEVAKQLNFKFFDKSLMVKIAGEIGISERELVDFSEEQYRSKGFFERLFLGSGVVANVSTTTRDSTGIEQHLVRKMDEDSAIDLVRASVLAAYERGDVMIVGRGGQHILQDKADVFHVRVIADEKTRLDRLTQFEGVKFSEAYDVMTERDKANEEYHKRFYGAPLDDPTLYHLIINTSKWGVEESAGVVLAAFKEFQKAAIPLPG